MKQRWQIGIAAAVVIVAGAFGYYSNNRPEASGIGDVNVYIPDPKTIWYLSNDILTPTSETTKVYDSFTMKSRRSDYTYRWHAISLRGTNARLVENCSPGALIGNQGQGENINSVRIDDNGLKKLTPIDIPDYVFIYGFDAKTQKYVRVEGSTPLEGGKGYMVTSRDPITCLTFASEDEIGPPTAPVVKLYKGWNLVAAPLEIESSITNQGSTKVTITAPIVKKVVGIIDLSKVNPPIKDDSYKLKTALVRQAPYYTSTSDLLKQSQSHLPSILDTNNKGLFYNQAFLYRDKDGFKPSNLEVLTNKTFPCNNDCWEPGQAADVYAFSRVDLSFDAIPRDSTVNFRGITHTDSFATDSK